MEYRKCFIPTCKNDSDNAPGKIIVRIREDLREKWCREVKVDYFKVYAQYCCEDHFDPREDLQNYYRFKLMNEEPKLKPTALLRTYEVKTSRDSTKISKLLVEPEQPTALKPNKKLDDMLNVSSTCFICIPMKAGIAESGLAINPDQTIIKIETTDETKSETLEDAATSTDGDYQDPLGLRCPSPSGLSHNASDDLERDLNSPLVTQLKEQLRDLKRHLKLKDNIIKEMEQTLKEKDGRIETLGQSNSRISEKYRTVRKVLGKMRRKVLEMNSIIIKSSDSSQEDSGDEHL